MNKHHRPFGRLRARRVAAKHQARPVPGRIRLEWGQVGEVHGRERSVDAGQRGERPGAAKHQGQAQQRGQNSQKRKKDEAETLHHTAFHHTGSDWASRVLFRSVGFDQNHPDLFPNRVSVAGECLKGRVGFPIIFQP